MRYKRRITLLEIMIVISLISLIAGVVGYNMKGAIEKGKAFKTQQAINQVNDILQLEYAKGERTLEEIADNAEEVLKESGLVKNTQELIKDGWNQRFEIRAKNTKEEFSIKSNAYKNYLKRPLPFAGQWLLIMAGV